MEPAQIPKRNWGYPFKVWFTTLFFGALGWSTFNSAIKGNMTFFIEDIKVIFLFGIILSSWTLLVVYIFWNEFTKKGLFSWVIQQRLCTVGAFCILYYFYSENEGKTSKDYWLESITVVPSDPYANGCFLCTVELWLIPVLYIVALIVSVLVFKIWEEEDWMDRLLAEQEAE